jgi:DNA-binding response OmpR family regulator
MNKIAVVADDPAKLNRLTGIVRRHAQCASFADADVFLNAGARGAYDLAVIDCHATKVSGVDLVKRVRSSATAPNLPIILIADRNSDEDEVAGLLSGADDYVAKSVCEAILMARVNALLSRRAVAAERPMETHGNYSFDRLRLLSLAHEREQVLTTKEIDLALLLFRNIQQPLSRAYIMDHVWGQSLNVSSRTLDTHICHVRTKLGLFSANGYSLDAVYGFGYRLDETLMSDRVERHATMHTEAIPRNALATSRGGYQ